MISESPCDASLVVHPRQRGGPRRPEEHATAQESQGSGPPAERKFAERPLTRAALITARPAKTRITSRPARARQRGHREELGIGRARPRRITSRSFFFPPCQSPAIIRGASPSAVNSTEQTAARAAVTKAGVPRPVAGRNTPTSGEGPEDGDDEVLTRSSTGDHLPVEVR